MKVDLLIRNAYLILPEIGPIFTNILVTNGKVSGLRTKINEIEAKEEINVKGQLVLPGLIDPHIHLGMFQPLEARIKAESAFGISGGVTTFIRYFRRPESYLELLDEQINMFGKLVYQDYGFHLTLITPQQVKEIPEYINQYGIRSFKVYMNLRGKNGHAFSLDLRRGGNFSDKYNFDFNLGYLYNIFKTLSLLSKKVRLCVHAEDGEVVNQQIDEVRQLGVDGLFGWNYACPPLAEALAINQVHELAKKFRVPVYFPHIGSREAINALADISFRGIDFVAETCIHYLVLDTSSSVGVLAKVMPPIRTTNDQIAVWDAVENGLIKTIGSDHVAMTLEEKNPGDIWTTRSAFGGNGLILPVLLSEGVKKKRITLQQLSKITSYYAAIAFGLYPQKGTLLPGSDADFIVVDQDHEWTIKSDGLLSASDFCVYENMKVQGLVKKVYIRGNLVFSDGQFTLQPKYGQYLYRF
jgi:dihydropyrimidinase